MGAIQTQIKNFVAYKGILVAIEQPMEEFQALLKTERWLALAMNNEHQRYVASTSTVRNQAEYISRVIRKTAFSFLLLQPAKSSSKKLIINKVLPKAHYRCSNQLNSCIKL